MPSRRSFTAEIKAGRGGGAYAEVPFDVEEMFGDKRPAVKATIGGHPFLTRLVRMGTDCHIVGIPKEIRVQLGKNYGDSITISVEPDTAPRVVEVPPDLQAALNQSKPAKAFFEGLAFTHRKEYAQWVAEAKKPETRERRVSETIELLLAGKRSR